VCEIGGTVDSTAVDVRKLIRVVGARVVIKVAAGKKSSGPKVEGSAVRRKREAEEEMEESLGLAASR
jgi:hypothetical protein